MTSDRIEPAAAAEYFSAVMSHFIHLDATMWARVQYLGVAQAAAFTAAFQMMPEHHLVATAAFGVAVLISVGLWLMMKRDAAIRDGNKVLLVQLANDIAGETPARAFSFGPSPAWPAPMRGRQLNSAIFVLFFALDLIGGTYTATHPAGPSHTTAPVNACTCPHAGRHHPTFPRPFVH